MYLVLVSTPDVLPGHHRHTSDGLLGSAQVQQVVVEQVPLAVYKGRAHRVFLLQFVSKIVCREGIIPTFHEHDISTKYASLMNKKQRVEISCL